MFDFIEGELVTRNPGQVTILTGGFGVRLSVPLSTYDRLPEGGGVRLLAHMHVREDGVQMFGFGTAQERELFLLLNTVKGVGPRLALKILSGVNVGDFVTAVAAGDAAMLQKVPGVGRKTAERLSLELKDAVAHIGPDPSRPIQTGDADAVIALIQLGAGRSEAEKAVKKSRKALDPGATPEEIVRECLRRGYV